MRLAAILFALAVLAGRARAQEAPADTIPLEWSSTADAIDPDPPSTFVALCPPGGSAAASLYGTDAYTTDSSLCLAAVHAGVLTLSEGGPAVVVLGPGLEEYVGTTRNGLTSDSYRAWHGTVRFPGAPAAAEPRQVHEYDGTWYTRANQIDAPIGALVRFECSADGTGGNVWGTDVYTDDSSICEAAVHAGEITRADGGVVHFELLGAQDSFQGSERNGVTTMRYPGWPGSFRFVVIEAEADEGAVSEENATP